MEQINLKMIKNFDKIFSSNKSLKAFETLKRQSLAEVFENDLIEKENEFKFNLELPNTSIYNQGHSSRCWLFALLNFIKDNMAGNLGIDPVKFKLSSNFLSFFDKLEKSNTAYEYVINSQAKTFEEQVKMFLDRTNGAFLYFKNPVRESGRIEYARDLIEKYGIVPYQLMPDTKNAFDSDENVKLFSSKVKKDLMQLAKLKGKKSKTEFEQIKQNMLQENFNYLALVYGRPPIDFDSVKYFKDNCSINLKDYLVVGNNSAIGKEYFKRYRRKFSDNIYGVNSIEYINLPIQKLQEFAIKQLFDGLPVVIACENKKYRNLKSTVLDTRLFDYGQLIGTDMDKSDSLTLSDITLKHWMTIRGAWLENGLPIRWKVEDSAGENARTGGYYVMNHNFFQKCCLCLWINRKYLSEEVVKLAFSKPTDCYFGEPI